jgi:hypothetical protein
VVAEVEETLSAVLAAQAVEVLVPEQMELMELLVQQTLEAAVVVEETIHHSVAQADQEQLS